MYLKLLWSGLKEAIRKSYSAAIKSYTSYCATYTLQPWPATRSSLGNWIVLRANGCSLPSMGQISGKTLDSYIAALHSVHVDLNLDTQLFGIPHVLRLLAGVKNLFPHESKRHRKAISRSFLTELLSEAASSGEHPLDTLNLNAAFTMAFYGFMRMGEFTRTPRDLKDVKRFKAEKLTRRRVVPAPVGGEHFVFHLPCSKTDKHNKGVDIIIATSHDAACPWAHMHKLMTQDPQTLDAPLFQLQSGAFDRNNVLALLAARHYRLGKESSGILGHSFRKGAAQHAYEMRLSEQQIQTLGRWSSDSVKRYYKKSPTFLLNLQRQFITGPCTVLLCRTLNISGPRAGCPPLICINTASFSRNSTTLSMYRSTACRSTPDWLPGFMNWLRILAS